MSDQQKEEWLREQVKVCSQVIVRPDSDKEDAVGNSNNNQQQRFQKSTISRHDIGGRYFGGVDVSFPANDEKDPRAIAVYVILDAADNTKGCFPIVYQDHEYFRLTVPYLATFLAFREIEPLQRLVQKQQRQRPDVTPSAILVDGNGLLHPRGAGLACFLGVRTGIPIVGIGKNLWYGHGGGWITRKVVARGIDKSLLRAAKAITKESSTRTSTTSQHDICLWMDQTSIGGTTSVGDSMGGDTKVDRTSLLHKLAPHCHGMAIPLQLPLPPHLRLEAESTTTTTTSKLACALVGHGGRTCHRRKKNTVGTTNPIFVSVGHKISLRQAVQTTAFLSLTRIPEPVRQADGIGRYLLRRARDRDLEGT